MIDERKRTSLKVVHSLYTLDAAYLQRRNLQHGLSEVRPGEELEQALSGIIDAFGGVHDGLEAALVEPLLQIILMLLEVFGAHIRVAHDETADRQAFADDLYEISDRISFRWRLVVLGDHTASDWIAFLALVVVCR